MKNHKTVKAKGYTFKNVVRLKNYQNIKQHRTAQKRTAQKDAED